MDSGSDPDRAALGVLALIVGCLGCADTPPPRPPILLVTLDTTRADSLGCYGSDAETSPHLDALAAESVRYTRATSTSSWTLPAHASILTGKFTSSHGARADVFRSDPADEGDPGSAQLAAHSRARAERSGAHAARRARRARLRDGRHRRRSLAQARDGRRPRLRQLRRLGHCSRSTAGWPRTSPMRRCAGCGSGPKVPFFSSSTTSIPTIPRVRRPSSCAERRRVAGRSTPRPGADC